MNGITHENWRIRLSSVQLLGSLLLRIAGLSGRLFFGVPDEETAQQSGVTKAQEAAIAEALGVEPRDNIFATIYLMRADVVLAVRQMAWRVWKGVVTHTPRMLSFILPTLMNRTIYDLASNSGERHEAAGATLEDLVQKMGDTVLQQTPPILQDHLMPEDSNDKARSLSGFEASQYEK
eukprot:TRINITY_DN1929_c0_g1_i1.p1 TRINITY_DN1929_c0_g1~~TRINITY_DN1929_c0_g1_i1.p1  ORF type:complete len:178 (-),score=11.45 TRINITY_DN1929_c0_g1_i1:69-602(-)